MIVRVTPEHILLGEIGNCLGCPIALAILDSYPEHFVHVDGRHAWVTPPGCMRYGPDTAVYELPEAARRFVDVFDDDRRIAEPFSFELGEPLPRDSVS